MTIEPNTNAAITALNNSSTKLDAIIDHIENGTPLADPVLNAYANDPNPDITDDLAAKVTQLQSQIDSFYSWAQNH